MSEIYLIINLEKYANYMRKKAAFSYCENQTENLEEFITTHQVCGLINELSIGNDESGKLLINENGCEKLLEAIKIRIYNCGLSKLAAAGTLECAWDEKTNEMIFWKSNNEISG
jgi:hypothetical protein